MMKNNSNDADTASQLPKKVADKQSIHKDHRIRLKKRFRQQGLDSFEMHNVLELVLFYGVPVKDTNEEAHRLLDTFGSLVNVFDAPYEDLIKVKGISENSATLIKLIPQLCSLYYDAKAKDDEVAPDNLTEHLGKRLKAKYINEINEVTYLICLDNRLRILYFGKMGEGSNDSVSIESRKIIEISLRCNANSVILAHNHPIGLAEPSHKDRETTKRLYHSLASVSIKLLDHIVVARDDYYSMAAHGMLSPSLMDAMRSGSSLGDEQQPQTATDNQLDWDNEDTWNRFIEIP